jgi:pimeloyl-ACP methyl ester carboxylesterase
MNRIKYLFFIFTLVYCGNVYSQSAIEGHWEGAINVFGNSLGIKVNFKNDADSLRGTIDIPQQNAKDLKLIHCSLKNTKVYFELPAGPGLAVFDGLLFGDSMAGYFTQAGFAGKFYLKKGELKPEENTQVGTDSSQVSGLYTQEEVTFTNGENKFAGTLTIPRTEGKHPAVVMITGSGAQNRDEEIVGFKPFKIIADYLSSNGIAVLRYDDRGVGGSTGKTVAESTTEEFAGDVNEAVKFLKSRTDVNPDQVGLIGHSEGGIIAPMVASKYNGVAFIVLMAGTGVMGIDILKEQSRLIMKADNSTDEEIKGYQKMLDMVYDAMKNNKGWDELKKMFRQSMEESYKRMSKEQKKSIKSREDYINSMTDITINEFKSPWMQFFMMYDPYLALTKVTCPVLILFGEKDLQVPPAQNEKPMTDALTKGGNKDFIVKKFPDGNHLFQKAITGNPSEYATLPMEFVPGFLDAIKDWITERVTIVK